MYELRTKKPYNLLIDHLQEIQSIRHLLMRRGLTLTSTRKVCLNEESESQKPEPSERIR